MTSKDTGFHPSDPDWTRGRAQALADAEAFARRQMGLSRNYTLAKPLQRIVEGAKTAPQWDTQADRLAITDSPANGAADEQPLPMGL